MTAYQLFPEDSIFDEDAAKPCHICGTVLPLTQYHEECQSKGW